MTPGPGRPVAAWRHGAPLPTRPRLAPRPEHLWIAALAAEAALAAMRVAGLHGPRAWAPLLPLGFVLMAAPFVVPVLLVLVGVLKATGHTPFFTQERVGKSGRSFKLWKLRTMVPDAEARLQTASEEEKATSG